MVEPDPWPDNQLHVCEARTRPEIVLGSKDERAAPGSLDEGVRHRALPRRHPVGGRLPLDPKRKSAPSPRIRREPRSASLLGRSLVRDPSRSPGEQPIYRLLAFGSTGTGMLQIRP